MSKLNQVDVLFPTRNRVDEALITITKLKEVGIEESQIFIGDDYSDASLRNSISEKFPGVKIFSNTSPKGQLFTRNFLFKHSNRKYILSIDDDSHVVSKEMLEEAINILEENKNAGIFGFRAFQQIEIPPPQEQLSHEQFETRTFIACGALIKRECINQIGNYTRDRLGYYCEEIDCSIRAFKKGFTVVTKNDLVVHHRVNRNYKEMPKKTDAQKGVFGSEWRSVMGFSDNLIVTLIYFPVGFDLAFFVIYIFKRFFLFTIKNSDYSAFIKGIIRTFSFLPYIVREKSSMSYSQFLRWIRLPMM
ncbi:MAG: glycosyltransferase [Cyclobacteriaceae bacterium]